MKFGLSQFQPFCFDLGHNRTLFGSREACFTFGQQSMAFLSIRASIRCGKDCGISIRIVVAVSNPHLTSCNHGFSVFFAQAWRKTSCLAQDLLLVTTKDHSRLKALGRYGRAKAWGLQHCLLEVPCLWVVVGCWQISPKLLRILRSSGVVLHEKSWLTTSLDLPRTWLRSLASQECHGWENPTWTSMGIFKAR